MTGSRGANGAGGASDGPPPVDLGQFAGSPAVQRWLDQTGGGGDPAERGRALQLLQRFCSFRGTSPDDLVAQCLRATKSGDTAISAVGRRATDEAITAFVATEGLAGHEAIALGNRLRGFLIHNGIFLQGPASIT